MPIQYNGASLAPQFDLGQAIQIALAGAEKREVEQKQAEAAGLGDQLDLASQDPLHNPENLRLVQRMQRLDPQAAQLGIGILKLRSEGELQAAAKEAGDVSKFYQAFLDTSDPVERNRFLGSQIRTLEEAGKDTSKLREMMALTPDKQSLMARRQVILAGDAETLAGQGLASLKQALDVQGQQLKNFQTQQEIERAAREDAAGKESDVAGLRKEFSSKAEDFIKVRDARSRLQASAARNTAAGDISLIFNYMKMLDPGSTVREGEAATAQQATGVPSQILNLYNRAITGERLNPEQRADFIATGESLYSKATEQHGKLVSEYTRLANRRGFAPEDVIVDFSAPAGGGGAAPAASPPSVPASRYSEGAVLRNKATGERWIVQGGQWVLTK